MILFEVKINFFGIDLDPFALWKRFSSKDNRTIMVAERFLKIFQDHDVAITQIPRLIPELSLDQLNNAEALRPALTPKILQQTAELFGIKLEWLEGITNQIYDYDYCYKAPWRLLEHIRTLKVDGLDYPMAVFCRTKKINYAKGQGQAVVLVLREKIAQFDEKTIYRYHIYDEFDWGYWKSRIQLKAMVRILGAKFQIPVIPMYQVDKKILREIESGRAVPIQYYGRVTTDPSLEDYTYSPEESAVSKESDELPTVFRYIKAYRLDSGKKPGSVTGEMAKFI
jgi:hypothetical protein